MQRGNDEAGDWRGLDSSGQAPRYAAIAEILRSFKADGNVMDVGCGEAVLRPWLPTEAGYIGIEPSATAAKLASERIPAAKIFHTTAENFEPPDERFDSIVFNEMLYYSFDPVGLLQKYAKLVRPDGVILCSIFQKPGPVSLKSRVRHWLDPHRPFSNIHCEQMTRAFMARQSWPILDDRVVTIPGSHFQWHIWLARPPAIQSGRT